MMTVLTRIIIWAGKSGFVSFYARSTLPINLIIQIIILAQFYFSIESKIVISLEHGAYNSQLIFGAAMLPN